MRFLFVFVRRPWYRLKRVVIPICILIALLITAVILGAVMGTRSRTDPLGIYL